MFLYKVNINPACMIIDPFANGSSAFDGRTGRDHRMLIVQVVAVCLVSPRDSMARCNQSAAA
jgi:hypothetical protein